MSGNKQLKSIALLLWLLANLQFTFAQSKTVSGRVVDSKDGSSLANVSVIAKRSNLGTQTDSNGNFRLTVPSHIKALIVSAIGFSSQEVEINKISNVEVKLIATASSLGEVVVIGYGTIQRKDLTGAVDKVTAEDFNKGIISNPLQQVQGKVAGLVITQPGGDPNGDLIVRIRGATSIEGQPPLLVIDGVAIDDFNKAITTLNPADVESFDILKDASACAIYGARGGNGVIIVTTKSARAGRVSLSYDGFVGVETISHKINVLTADEWRNATGASGASLDKGATTDWQKMVTRTAISHSHTISLSGGSNQVNFQGSVGYTKQDGIILNTGKEAFISRLVANQNNFNNKLQVKYGINTTVTTRDFLPDQFSTSQARNSGSGFFEGVLHALPVLPAYNTDGTYYPGLDPTNPAPLFVINSVYSKKRENFFQTSVKADYELIKGFKAGILGALSRANDVYDFFNPIAAPSVAFKSNDNKQTFSGDIHSSYKRRFDKHSVEVTGIYEYNKYVNDGFSVLATGFLVPDLLNNNLGAANNVQPGFISSYKNEVKLISFLGRIVYNFDDRYILTANFRRDGSSKFGPNHRWGNFPSVAAAWRVSNEKFLNRIKWLDNLKMRFSYGFTGNQENLPPNSYQLLYGPAGPYLYNGQFAQSYAVSQENNPDLRWEVRKSFNIGVDFSAFNDRLQTTFDVFNDKTSDMLFRYDLPQPPFLTNQVYANAANAINSGVEVSCGIVVLRKNNFTWDIHGNVATLKNKITNLSGQFRGVDLKITSRHYGYAYGPGLSGAYVTELHVGYPAGVFWVPQHAGFDIAGHELYNNYDAEHKLVGISTSYSDLDRVYIDPTPRYTWGLTNEFNYKNFDVSFLLRGVQGEKIFANSLMNLESVVYLPSSNITKTGLHNGFTDQPQPSDYWIRNGSSARLENITLSYNFKNLRGVNNLRLYLTATNLFVITSYDGIDPEIKVEGSQRYIDSNYYPKTTGFVLGVSIEL